MFTDFRSARFIGICCLIGAVCGYIGFKVGSRDVPNTTSLLKQFRPIREQQGEYKFISPLLAYETVSGYAFNEFVPLENELTKLIEQKKQGAVVGDVSVYYRDLNTGRWAGVNENDSYVPASLLKAVIMIAYFKQAEDHPATMNQAYTFSKTALKPNDSPFNAPSLLEDQKMYSVSDLIRAVIVESDNGAKDLLLANIDKNSLSEIYSDLGLQDPEKVGEQYKISAKNYSLFFRVLYNSTYLSRAYSEKALELLSDVTFSDGLKKGLPKGVTVAHKFGESINSSGGSLSIELHDCGIVYKPDKPFLLCIMTKGKKLEELENTIQELTEYIYNNAP